MLVCAYTHSFGTRDRGCSAHPAFPAPSLWGVAMQNPGAIRRGNAFRRPCERRDPYAAAYRWSAGASCLCVQSASAAMGPCFRRDDERVVGTAQERLCPPDEIT